MFSTPMTMAAAAVGTYYLRNWMGGGVCDSDVKLHGRTVVITGANTGIGYETARDLSRRGARVIMACRNINAARKAAERVTAETKEEVVVYHLDLSDLESVRKCAEEICAKEKAVDVLVNNAGVMMCPEGQTSDGFETQFGTNHLGHFLFTNLLLDKLKMSHPGPARIVNVSSKAHRSGEVDLDDLDFKKRGYGRLKAYQQSKLANVLFTAELDRRLKKDGLDGQVTCYSLHPGVVRTELGRHLEEAMGSFKYLLYPLLFLIAFVFTKSAEQGAQTSIYCSVDKSLESPAKSGKYYADCEEKEPAPQAKDLIMAKKLWDKSAEMVKLNQDQS